MNLRINDNIRIIVAGIMLALTLAATAHAKTKVETVYLNAANTVPLATDINYVGFDLVTFAIVAKRTLLPHDQTLHVVIGSNGGFYEVGKMFVAILNAMDNIDLICNQCHSAAGYIFALSNHRRLVHSKSLLMMHEMYNPHATAAEMSDPAYVEEFVQSSEDFNTAIATVLKMDLEDYKKKIIGKSWTPKGEEIVKNHLADAVVKIQCDAYVKRIAPQTCGSADED